MISIRQAAALLDGDINGGDQVLCPGPNHSRNDRSLSVRFSADGFTVHSFASNNWSECRDYVRERLRLEPWRPRRQGYSPALGQFRLRKLLPPEPKRTGPDKSAMELWSTSLPPQGTLVTRYLRKRHLELPEDAGEFCRYHPSLYAKETGRVEPGMLTLMRHVKTNEPWSVQRTFIAPDGSKLISPDGNPIGRKYTGSPEMCAIKINSDEHVHDGLAIGEGFETCLAARHFGFRPVWAVGDRGRISAFPVLEGIEALTILGENDPNGANERAALECQTRWENAGREVYWPLPAVGKDFNDALIKACQ